MPVSELSTGLLIWPKDRKYRGRSRGVFGRLHEVLTGKGPDMFVGRRGERTNIPTGKWSNWETFFNPELAELSPTIAELERARGQRRYDPEKRRYRRWYPTCYDGGPV